MVLTAIKENSRILMGSNNNKEQPVTPRVLGSRRPQVKLACSQRPTQAAPPPTPIPSISRCLPGGIYISPSLQQEDGIWTPEMVPKYTFLWKLCPEGDLGLPLGLYFKYIMVKA